MNDTQNGADTALVERGRTGRRLSREEFLLTASRSRHLAVRGRDLHAELSNRSRYTYALMAIFLLGAVLAIPIVGLIYAGFGLVVSMSILLSVSRDAEIRAVIEPGGAAYIGSRTFDKRRRPQRIRHARLTEQAILLTFDDDSTLVVCADYEPHHRKQILDAITTMLGPPADPERGNLGGPEGF